MALPLSPATFEYAFRAFLSTPDEASIMCNAKLAVFDGPQIYYCPTCDSMAYIGRMEGFRPEPWRADKFSWRKPPINAAP